MGYLARLRDDLGPVPVVDRLRLSQAVYEPRPAHEHQQRDVLPGGDGSQILADCLREASTRTQLIVATHADRLVRFLQPSEVVTFDMEDGVTTATRAEDLDLEEWLSEYTLD